MAPEPAVTSGVPVHEAPDADADPGRYEPRVHGTVVDTGSKKVGRIMGLVGPYAQLRPVGGGLEWDARPEDLRPATTTEALSAGVAVANARSRGECT
ncbi:hypothetical protein OG352_05710 [Streptomyces sp. NBC_01485]|uniref:hypothetical protein n=1 Tax=Streptomyces sp. NBC_01485 TaxID=2903884 RepID=UPI002E36068B|nr:hypothetical protein [Streptomyces sp. NBC_01485]